MVGNNISRVDYDGERTMMRYINYLKYVIRHKWYVFLGALKVDPYNLYLIYLAIIHDMSKFGLTEFGQYARTFYKPDGSNQYVESLEFSYAWNHHQKCNKHHWQYWMLKYDRGDVEMLPIPDIYIKEMIADWIGAGWAITGKWDNVFDWYRKVDVYKNLHPTTKHKVEDILLKLENK